ncbi:hypothetical protein MLD38_005114 [Melastoma candidum]|uniref:Uncharacterized protein n=1 Tax=Melastoma candidum TaxID=119954 RepID=A0ACB9S725_9MYRT|nr:hypothetical protein MLD38_005114 [Melastoma candidum]
MRKFLEIIAAKGSSVSETIILAWELTAEVLLQRINMYFWIRSSPVVVPSNLAGLVVVITGATNGIGFYTARELAFAGAHVVMACRRVDSARKIVDQWEEEAEGRKTLNLEVMELDLLSLSSVRQFGTNWTEKKKPLHILINNAGILLLGESWQLSGDGLEKHIQVNHISPALLTVLLLPFLLMPSSARIVNVNSVAHKWGSVEPKSWNGNIEEKSFRSMKAYGSSKLVNLMFLKALTRKLTLEGKNSILCIAVHPGTVATNLLAQGRMRGIWMMHSSEGARNVLLAAAGSEIEVNPDGFTYYNQNGPGRTSSVVDDMEGCRRVWDETMSVLGNGPDFSC